MNRSPLGRSLFAAEKIGVDALIDNRPQAQAGKLDQAFVRGKGMLLPQAGDPTSPIGRRDPPQRFDVQAGSSSVDHTRLAVSAAPSGFDGVRRIIDLRCIVACDESDEKLLSHTRAARMVAVDNTILRVKNISYGNARAAEEVVMAKFYALTGLDCPDSAIAMHGNHLFRFNAETRRDYDQHKDHPDDFAMVASPLIPGFRDLGHCLLDGEAMRPVIKQRWGEAGAAKYDRVVKMHASAIARERSLNALQPIDLDENDPFTMQKQQARAAQLKAMLSIYAMLPPHLHYETTKAYCASRLIANWDFVNYAWYNVGFHDLSKPVNEWRLAMVDFGNTGTMGFGGLQKPQSKERVNRRARPTDPQQPFPIREVDANFSGEVGASRTSIGALPRARPIAPLIQSLIHAETRIAECSSDPSRIPKHEINGMSAAFDAGYRMSLIPDAAFHRIANQHWPEGTMPFPRHQTDSLILSANEMAEIMIQRRDALVGQFTSFEFAAWKSRHADKAQAAFDEVTSAVVVMTGIDISHASLGGDSGARLAGEKESTASRLARRNSR